MNDADRAQTIFVGCVIAGVLVAATVVLSFGATWPWNWVAGCALVMCGVLGGYWEPHVWYYQKALGQWQAGRDMARVHQVERAALIVMVIGVAGIVLMAGYNTYMALASAFLLLASVSGMYLSGSMQRYLHDVIKWEQTYHYRPETAEAAETGGATGC